jgi:lipopolysaccharide biosynthesis regulator YciM
MCEMLANKYLVEGQIEKAIPVYEEMLAQEPSSRSLLYSLLVCYALEGRCADVWRTAERITRYYEGLELEMIRLYETRFPDDTVNRIKDCLSSVCRQQEQVATWLNRMVLSELLGDEVESRHCRHEMEILGTPFRVS